MNLLRLRALTQLVPTLSKKLSRISTRNSTKKLRSGGQLYNYMPTLVLLLKNRIGYREISKRRLLTASDYVLVTRHLA